MIHVISFMTWRCGLNCPYCGYYLQLDGLSVKYRPAPDIVKVEREITPDKWIALLKSLAPASYDFCGGEPTRYEGLETILATLPDWAITSNTTLDPERLKKFPLKSCTSWTASFHYNAPAVIQELFRKNVAYLKDVGVNTSVTLVALPDTVDRVIKFCEEFRDMGIHAQVHPYYDEPTFTWNNYPKEWEVLRQSKFVCYDEVLKSWIGIRGENKTCRGGSKYICIGPDGKLYRCLWHMLSGQQPIEQPSKFLHYCSLNCYLPCDFVYGLHRSYETRG
jgi:sulfatase maturation enzyme AslB (radical SAM superfamily)